MGGLGRGRGQGASTSALAAVSRSGRNHFEASKWMWASGTGSTRFPWSASSLFPSPRQGRGRGRAGQGRREGLRGYRGPYGLNSTSNQSFPFSCRFASFPPPPSPSSRSFAVPFAITLRPRPSMWLAERGVGEGSEKWGWEGWARASSSSRAPSTSELSICTRHGQGGGLNGSGDLRGRVSGRGVGWLDGR